MSTFKGVFLCLLFLPGLLGCSALTGVVVSNLDFLVKIEMDSAFDLTDEQKKRWKGRWSSNLTALAKEDFFKAVAEDLDAFATSWRSNGITFNSMDKISKRMLQLWSHPGGQQLLNQAAEFLHMMGPKNYTNFQNYMREKTDERFEHRLLNKKEFKEARIEKALDAFEDWYGSYSKMQKEKISDIIATDLDLYKDQYLQRVQAEKSLIVNLGKFSSKSEIVNAIRYWSEKPETLRTGKLQKVYLDYQQKWKTRMVELDKLVTSEQRDKAVAKLEEAIDLMFEIDRKWRTP